MTATLLFHIGDFKTGTTAIQTWLAAQGAEQGLFHPDIDAAALAHSLKSPEAVAPAFQGLARALRPARAMRAPGVAVVSSEHFEHADPAALARAIDAHLPDWGGRVRILAYVRPHGAALLARYGESVKIGNFTGDPAAYLEWAPTRWRLNTHGRFLRWRAAFGARFALRLYDRGAFAGGDVVRDFVQAAGGRDPGPLAPAEGAAPTVNPTPGLRDLAMLRALHGAIGTWPEGSAERAAQWALGRDLGDRLARRSGPPAARDRLVLDRPLAQRLVKLCARDAAATDADFLDRPALAAALEADLQAAPDTAPMPDPDRLLPPEARAALELWGDSLARGLAQPGGAAALQRLIGAPPGTSGLS